VFGIGPQEVIIIVLLVVVIFGPGKAATLARDLGRFASEARRPVEEFKDELYSSTSREDRDDGEAASDLRSEEENRARQEEEKGRKLVHKKEALPTEVRAQAKRHR
jgi:Sec-independent protein translocase protein TatA